MNLQMDINVRRPPLSPEVTVRFTASQESARMSGWTIAARQEQTATAWPACRALVAHLVDRTEECTVQTVALPEARES